MLVSKIVVKIMLKTYGENSPRADLPIVIHCGIRVVFSTLKALISLIDTSLMIVAIKMHEKDR